MFSCVVEEQWKVLVAKLRDGQDPNPTLQIRIHIVVKVLIKTYQNQDPYHKETDFS